MATGTTWYRTGTATVTQGSKYVVGVDTLWSTSIYAGDEFRVGRNAGYEIDEVIDNTHITLKTAYSEANQAGVDYAIILCSPRHGEATEISRKLAEIVEEQQAYFDATLQTLIGPTGPAGLTSCGLWASGASYSAGDYVSYGGAAYLCISDISGTSIPSSDTEHWTALNTSVVYKKAGVNL